jgi:hypothetical protein
MAGSSLPGRSPHRQHCASCDWAGCKPVPAAGQFVAPLASDVAGAVGRFRSDNGRLPQSTASSRQCNLQFAAKILIQVSYFWLLLRLLFLQERLRAALSSGGCRVGGSDRPGVGAATWKRMAGHETD